MRDNMADVDRRSVLNAIGKGAALGVLGLSASASASAALEEDCIPHDPENLTIHSYSGGWQLRDGSHLMMSFDEREEAERTREIIRHYGMDSHCFVGRPNASMEYFLVDGNAPLGSIEGEDCLPIDPTDVELRERSDGSWQVITGGHIVLAPPNEQEARKAKAIIEEYGFEYNCYVGRPDASMLYFRRDFVLEPPIIDFPPITIDEVE